jgi:hypothetical protein
MFCPWSLIYLQLIDSLGKLSNPGRTFGIPGKFQCWIIATLKRFLDLSHVNDEPSIPIIWQMRKAPYQARSSCTMRSRRLPQKKLCDCVSVAWTIIKDRSAMAILDMGSFASGRARDDWRMLNDEARGEVLWLDVVISIRLAWHIKRLLR